MISKMPKLRAAFVVAYALCVGSVVLRAQVPIEVGSRDRTSSLPDGAGRNLVIATCTQCHSLGPIVLQRKSEVQWVRTVRDMIARGAQIAPDEIELISTYLSQSFGPGSAGSGSTNEKSEIAGKAAAGQREQASTESLPEGAAKGIIRRSCVDCHALNRITTKRKDSSGWLASVKDMVRLGANLRPEEIATVVEYLATNFGPDGVSQSGRSSAGSTGNASRPADLSALLPDKEGKGLILATCVQCHSLQTITGQRKEPEGWKRTVHDMVSRGAQLTWSESELVARYLAESFGK
ncbi:MAG TPA: hypothetical protein VKN18_25745 [Blastocatellia bacterium]|nr:hypothetical protein [Blastocatellia bacterium]